MFVFILKHTHLIGDFFGCKLDGKWYSIIMCYMYVDFASEIWSFFWGGGRGGDGGLLVEFYGILHNDITYWYIILYITIILI